MANPRNLCHFIGRIPNHDAFNFTYTENEDPKRCRVNGCISVRRNYKRQDEQYYPEDIINFVAFGGTATFLNKYFKKGDTVELLGSIEQSADWTDQNGETRKGRLSLVVSDAAFPAGGENSNAGSNNNHSASSAPKSTNPLADRMRQMKKSII